jgi:hypothetical protein
MHLKAAVPYEAARSHSLHREKLRNAQHYDGECRHEEDGHLPPQPGCISLTQPNFWRTTAG